MGNAKSRRDFLTLTGGALGGSALLNSPAGLLLESLTRGLYSTAMAQAAGVTPRKWVDFRLDGAPPRWVFDLFLTPYTATCPYVHNRQVGTKFVLNGQNVAVDVEYKTVARHGINVPWVWQFPVPKAGGGTRPMAELLTYLLHVRGVNAANPAHGGAQALHYRPLGALQTITALSADHSTAPIPAIYSSVSSYQFGSLAAKSPVRLGAANLIQELLTPFLAGASATYKNNAQTLKTYLTAANRALGNHAKANSPRQEVPILAQNSARELFERSFGDLTLTWDTLLAKYTDLVKRAFDPTVEMVGINDNPIGVSGTRDETHRVDSQIVTASDMRTLVQSTTNSPQVARAFALAEFVLVNNLSDSITIGLGGISGIKVQTAASTSTMNHSNDEHFTGKMATLLLNTYWAKAQAACMLELIDRLKAAGMFGNTVMNISGEFNRRPRTSGIGADHGQEATTYSFYSGAIKGPYVVGNIRTELANQTEYTGTWGYGAPITTMGGLTMDLASTAASIATMLRTPSPVTARATFLKENDDGTIAPKIELAKNVA